MGKIINFDSRENVERLNHLRGLSDHEKEYACKLIAILKRENEERKRALEVAIDSLFSRLSSD